MAQLYGHRPPPALTANEAQLIGVVGEEFAPAAQFGQQLPELVTASLSVALVRLRNRGLVESTEELSHVQWNGQELRRVRLWRRVQQEGAAHAR